MSHNLSEQPNGMTEVRLRRHAGSAPPSGRSPRRGFLHAKLFPNTVNLSAAVATLHEWRHMHRSIRNTRQPDQRDLQAMSRWDKANGFAHAREESWAQPGEAFEFDAKRSQALTTDTTLVAFSAYSACNCPRFTSLVPAHGQHEALTCMKNGEDRECARPHNQ